MAAFWPSNATVETRLLTFFYSVVSTKKTIHEAYQTTPENQGIVVFRCGRLWDDDTLIERTRNAPWRWHYHLMLTKTSHLFCCAAASPSTKTSVVYSACLINLSWLWRCCHIFLHLRRTIGLYYMILFLRSLPHCCLFVFCGFSHLLFACLAGKVLAQRARFPWDAVFPT